MAAATAAENAAAAARAKKLNLEKATNFMRQYRDPQSRELKKLSANQFMEVWSHYDRDGEYFYKHNKIRMPLDPILLKVKLLKARSLGNLSCTFISHAIC
jgi:hypothetical protein